MRRILLPALLASLLALPAVAQPTWRLKGLLIEPRNPTTSDVIRLTVIGEGQCYVFKPGYQDATGLVVVDLVPQDCISVPSYHPIRETFEIGPLPAGRHFAEIPFGDGAFGVNWRELFEVREDTMPLALGDDFEVGVHWSNPRGNGGSGTGHPVRMARDSGAFWFFSPDNLEVTVKILDGRAVNGRWWVFIASMTDVQFEVEISRAGGPVKTYVQTAGANRNFIDVNASFEAGPGTGPVAPDVAVDPEHPNSTNLVRIEVVVPGAVGDVELAGVEERRFLIDSESDDLPGSQSFATGGFTVGTLAPGLYRVDVRRDGIHQFGRTFEVAAWAGPGIQLRGPFEDHFDIEVRYRLPGHTGFATAPGVQLTRDAGYFYFFDPGNVEVTVKIVDGRALNGHWWVFLANMTTVALQIDVFRCPRDGPPIPCVEKTYVQPAGQNVNFLDIDTF